MAFDIHAPVKDADDFDPAGRLQPVKQHMRSDCALEVAGTYFVDATPLLSTTGEIGACRYDLTDIALRLSTPQCLAV